MSDSQNPKSDKMQDIKKWVIILLVFALFVASLGIALNTADLAQKNKRLMDIPSYDLSFVPGGPERFSALFGSVDYADTEKEIDTDQFYWATVILRNTSSADTGEVKASLQTAISPSHVLVKIQGRENRVNVSSSDKKNTKNMTFGSINPFENTYIFLGFSKENLPATLKPDTSYDWLQNYEYMLSGLHVEVGDEILNMYGKGFPGQEKE